MMRPVPVLWVSVLLALSALSAGMSACATTPPPKPAGPPPKPPPPPPKAELSLSVLPHACKTGPHGVVAWKVDGHTLATQPPGGPTQVVRIPIGTHRVEATVGRVVLMQRRILLEASKKASLRVGCDGGLPVPPAPRLLPLTVVYAPPAGCAKAASVRLAGKALTLQPGEGYTVYLPPGRHELVWGRDERQAQTLETVGSVLRRGSCIETGQPERTGKTP